MRFFGCSDDPATAGGRRLFTGRGIALGNKVENVDIDCASAGARRIGFVSDDGNAATADDCGFCRLALV